ncbi:hypothetical protein T02_1579 [Trichinella nativa]|uniref:Uncharacterized protein n=2 Tax=Trichinella TaxID=6333 RepID=A0A0V1LHZ7_9BILA|nr:hypothetical protein T03_14153 [Trichinella britovi]KRZ58983.1 hypothetical protein T02_1579 [Trichinella nativa]
MLRAVLRKQPPHCPKGGKSPAHLPYLKRTVIVQLVLCSDIAKTRRFRCSKHAPTGFGPVAGDSLVKCGPGHRTRSTPLLSVWIASGTAVPASLPSCPSAAPKFPQSWLGRRSPRQRRRLFAAGLPRYRLHIPPTGMPF